MPIQIPKNDRNPSDDRKGGANVLGGPARVAHDAHATKLEELGLVQLCTTVDACAPAAQAKKLGRERLDATSRSHVLWQSADGQSRVHNVDSLAFMESIPADSIDCIWTDPPYMLSNDGFTCANGQMVKVNKGEWDRSQGVEADHEFHRMWLSACHRILKPGGSIWVSGTVHVYPSVGLAVRQVGFRILNDIVWQKPSPPPNLGCRCFTHSTEILLWATKAKKGGKAKYKFNYAAMKEENGGKQMKNVWCFPPPSTEEKKFGNHPTQKPVALIARCLRATTDPGDLVFDPFLGSGSTGVAALGLGCHFIGCEQNTDYAALAARRLDLTIDRISRRESLQRSHALCPSDGGSRTEM